MVNLRKMIDNQLRQRILSTLRWMIADMKWRHNETKDLAEGATPEYSPQLRESIELLNELEQPAIFTQTNKNLSPNFYTEQQCKDTAIIVGLTEEQGSEFFHQYQSQGWLKGNGLPITDLRSQMVLWRNRQAERGQIPPAERNGQGRTPLARNIEESGR